MVRRSRSLATFGSIEILSSVIPIANGAFFSGTDIIPVSKYSPELSSIHGEISAHNLPAQFVAIVLVYA